MRTFRDDTFHASGASGRSRGSSVEFSHLGILTTITEVFSPYDDTVPPFFGLPPVSHL